jgi:hypothetical protein
MGVGDSDICAIPFKGNAVVPVIHSPVIEGNVRGADRVSSVRVCFLRQFYSRVLCIWITLQLETTFPVLLTKILSNSTWCE